MFQCKKTWATRIELLQCLAIEHLHTEVLYYIVLATTWLISYILYNVIQIMLINSYTLPVYSYRMSKDVAQ